MKVLIFLFTLLAVLPLSAAEKKPRYSQDFLLPVNHAAAPRYNLRVLIPKKFKPLQPLGWFNQPQEYMIEYIPEKENGQKWSEIITVNKFIGRKIGAIKAVEGMKRELLANTKSGAILEETSSKENGIEKAQFLMSYRNGKKWELIGVMYSSGPYDAAGVQYTVKIKSSMTEIQATEKINTFFSQNVILLPF